MQADPSDEHALRELLTPQERRVQQNIRRFVEDEHLPIAREHFAAGTFPTELLPRLTALGCFGPTVPVEYGGADLNPVSR